MIEPVSMFACKTELYHGFGSTSSVGKHTARFGVTKALLVTDAGVRRAGLLQDVEEALQAAHVSYVIFDEVEEDPDIKTMHNGTLRLKEEDCNGVVVIGGGSPVCAAKGIALEATNGGSIREYAGQNRYRVPPLPVICLPTTAGAGSDVSRVFVFHDAEQHK